MNETTKAPVAPRPDARREWGEDDERARESRVVNVGASEDADDDPYAQVACTD